MTKTLMAGMDLHSNNVMIGIMDQEGRRLKHQKLPCDFKAVDGFLKPFKSRLKSVAVESTFNWYWLVDGLRQSGYPAVLANPAGIEQYSGVKHADDQHDAYFLADVAAFKHSCSTGYVYDPELRPVRDLLRRRVEIGASTDGADPQFQKPAYVRTTGQELPLSRLKGMEVAEAATLYEHPANQLIAQVQKEHIEQLNQSIGRIEKAVLACARELPYYERLNTLPGI